VEHIINRAVDIERLAHIVTDKLEVGASHQVVQVLFAPCNQVIHDHHLPAFGKQAFHQMRANKTCASRDDSARH
jgi:hypothetical protein